MANNKHKILLVSTSAAIFLAFMPVMVSAADDLIIDKSDGSRGEIVHLLEPFDEEGTKISPNDDFLMPFSTEQTCGQCHEYARVASGWHFNAMNPEADPGRPGEPWIYFDKTIHTQIPLSYRDWAGAWNPADIGMSPMEFTKRFGIQSPGGGPGEMESEIPNEIMRQYVSGKQEINCLSCHNAHWGQEQKEYALQIARENFRWAPAGASEKATVSGIASTMPDTWDPFFPDSGTGSPPEIEYHADAFGPDGKMLFDIKADAGAQRCYFCHSTALMSEDAEKWMTESDVHMASGLSCVDCHRNGVDHHIVRGNEGGHPDNPVSAQYSCVSCHEDGRLGAPIAEHKGLPAVHFDRLSCTACHSGLKPEQTTQRIKTSRIHQLGLLHNDNREGAAVISPVFAENKDGKIEPCNLVWPSFWAVQDGENITPIDIELVKTIVRPVTDGTEELTEEMAAEILGIFAGSDKVKGTPVFITGGKLYRNEAGNLTSGQSEFAQPYLWAIGHDVRGAGDSLGAAANCQECHSTDSAFFFGDVEVTSAFAAAIPEFKKMFEFENVDPAYTKIFAGSFIFRPWLKAVLIAVTSLALMIILLFGFKALNRTVEFLGNEE
jgi:hypothetical protein